MGLLCPWPEHELKSWAHFKLGIENRGHILNWGLKIVGALYSGTMPAALTPEGIEIVGAFCNGDFKSWAHFIAGLCLQPWPQTELKSWAHVTEDN